MIIRKKQLLLLLFIIFATSFYAQKKEKATIHIKGGSIIYGEILQNDKVIVIRTNDGNIFAYPEEELEKIEPNTKPKLKNSAYHQMSINFSKSETEFNGGLKIVNGYQLASKVYFGIGLGIEGYYNRQYIPAVLDLQYHPLSHWSSSPYIATNFGKLLTQNDERNGWLFGGKIGFAHRLSHRVDLCTTFGYRHGVIERDQGFYDWQGIFHDNYREYEINRLEFGLGLMIK